MFRMVATATRGEIVFKKKISISGLKRIFSLPRVDYDGYLYILLIICQL